ncbi:hypothetical protein ACA910_003737 [Epithemia clementina (nom. ined.)]
MRLVPEVRNYTNPNTAAKCHELCAQQRAFMANMTTGASWEIASLDYPSSRHKRTLRELIMHLFKSGTAPNSPLFHSVDRWDLRGPVKFRFHPDDSVEAHATIASFLPMLRHYFRCTYDFEEQGITKLSTEEATALTPLLYRFFTRDAFTQNWVGPHLWYLRVAK